MLQAREPNVAAVGHTIFSYFQTETDNAVF